MYGDTGAIRALADVLRERADDIRREADRLTAAAEAVPWQGLAADAMRRRTHHRSTGLRRTARLHDDAADALDRHAREVDRVKELIAALERRFGRLVAAARDRLADAGRGLLGGLVCAGPDPADLLLDRFEPPPSGSREWLTVDLPGLG